MSPKITTTISVDVDQRLKIFTASLGTRRTPRVLTLSSSGASPFSWYAPEATRAAVPSSAVPVVIVDHHPFCYYKFCIIVGVIDTSHFSGSRSELSALADGTPSLSLILEG